MWKELEEVAGEEGRKDCKTTKGYLVPQTNNVSVSIKPEMCLKSIPKDNDLYTPLRQAK